VPASPGHYISAGIGEGAYLTEIYLFCTRCASEVTEEEWVCETCGRDTIDAGQVVLVKPKRTMLNRAKAEVVAKTRSATSPMRRPSL
jgi:hypothetical protein